MATQNAFAETFLGHWNSSQGKDSVASAIQENSLQDIVDGQYAFELTYPATVTIDLDSDEDTFLYLLSNNTNQIQEVISNDNDGIGNNARIAGFYDSGKYIIAPTTFSAQKNTSYVLTVAFSPNSEDNNYSGVWSDSTRKSSSSFYWPAGIEKPVSVFETYSAPKYRFTIDSQKEVRILLDSTAAADSCLFLYKITANGKAMMVNWSDDDGGDDIAGVNNSDRIGIGSANDSFGIRLDSYISQTLQAGQYIVIPTSVSTYDPFKLYMFGTGSMAFNVVLPNTATNFLGDTSAVGDEDTPISGTLQASDIEGLSGSYFSVTSYPTNGIAAIDGETGEWLYRPIESYSGEDTFTVTVTDDASGTTNQVISITINPVDDAANFSGDTSGVGDEDSAISGRLIASDAEGLTDDSYFTITTDPSDGTASIGPSNGIWQYTPILNYFGVDQFTVTVTDDAGGTSTQVISLTVNSVDDAAIFTSATSAAGNEDSAINGRLIASDAEGLTDETYFAVTTVPSNGNASIDPSNGIWQYTPILNYFGSDEFTITVSDDAGGTTTQVILLTINSVDDAAVFIGDVSGLSEEDNPITGTLTATDIDGLTDSSYYAVTEDPIHGTAMIDQTNGFWQYTPSANYFGTDTFTVTVTDDAGGTSAQTINISLNAVNDAPVITSNAVATATENQLYSYSVTTSDVEGDTLSLSVTSIPDWLNFNATTGILSGTPVHMHAEIGTYGVVIRADDGTDSVEQSFTITVEDVNNPPTVTFSVNNFIEDAGGLVAGASAAASYQTEDLDGDELTVTFKEGTNGNNHYSLDTAEKKIFLTQIGIDTINLGNPLDPISLTVVDVQTNASGGSNSQPTDPDMPDIPLEDPFDPVSSSPNNNADGSFVSETVTPGVTPSNDRPTATPLTDDNAVTAIEQTQTQPITLEGTDSDGEPPMIFLITGLPLNGYLKDDNNQITSFPTESPYTITGTLTYTSTSHTATSDSFTFKANDGEEDSEPATVTINIASVNDAPKGEVTISGIVAQGQTLTAKYELTDADGLGTVSLQWRADNQNITGADQTTYQLTQADINKEISVIASYTDTQKTQESVTSSNTTHQMLNQALSQLRADIANSSATDYVNAGITGVSDSNLTSINDAMQTVDTDNQNQAQAQAQAQIQQLVGSYNSILNYAADSSTSSTPIADDYSNIGIVDVTQDADALSLLNDVIALGDNTDVDTVSKLQALMIAVTSVINQAQGKTDTLSKQQLELLGVEGATDNNLLAIRQMIASNNQAMGKVENIQVEVNKAIASHTIQVYSVDSTNNPSPTLDDYKTIGLPHLVQADIETVNSVIEEQDSSAIESIEKIVALITADTDRDSTADIFDSFPNDASEISDSDADTIGDNADNCPNTANTNQANFDADAMGDACDPDEDNDGVNSAEDAFKFNPNYSSDTDGDGMADAYELEHSFDITNAGDKATDSDGDGISNLDEFLAGTNPRVNPNPGLPELVIPNDIQVVSTGRMTTVNIGVASAIDVSQAKLKPVASFTGPFGAGRHEVTWTASDSQGNQSKAVQVVKVLPLVNLTPSSLIAEGGVATIRAVLSGDAADYPVEIPYTISGSAINNKDYQIVLNNGQITIDEGREASFSIDIMVDNELENDETIEMTLDSPTNAVLGSVTQRTITIVDGNLPPQIAVVVEQDGNEGRVIAADKGEVTITATVSDPNPEDTHQFDWLIEPQQASAVLSRDNKVLVIDPSQLQPGIFSITAKAQDNADQASSTEVKTDFRLMETAPELSTEIDTDGDGKFDAEEGYADSDNDGIVDYIDNIEESNLAPASESSDAVLQATVGTQLVLGEMAFANAKNSVLVSKSKVIEIVTERQLQVAEGVDDKDYDYPVGLYDFTISGAIPSRSYYLVIPLPMVIEEGQIFRKYMGSTIGWQNFIENAQNTLFSAKAVDGACPEPASRIYDYGLQPGNNCMQIYIEDGGPNDADGKADGVVTDPAGIAVFNGTVEANNTHSATAPSSSLSSIQLSQSVLYQLGDKAVITINAQNNKGELLDDVTISVKCIFCLGVEIGQFIQTKPGVYEASIISGRQISFGFIEAELTNEFGSAKLAPQKLNVVYRPSGGCTVAASGRSDISLFLMLILLTLYHRRKKL
jgi:VCBS repeat-containing protein